MLKTSCMVAVPKTGAAIFKGVVMQASKIQAGFAALSIVVLLMSACGGGGGGGGSTTTGTSMVLSAYVANYFDGTISQYTINSSTGALTPKTPATVVSTPGNSNSLPTSIAVAVDATGNGKYAYVANSFADISQFTIGSGGVLQPMNPATVSSGPFGLSPTSVAVDPSGKYLYAANPSGNEVAQFNINPTTGVLTSMTQATVCAIPPQQAPCTIPASGYSSYAYVTVDPRGKYVYVTNQNDNSVSQFTINPTTGALTPMGTATVPTGSAPISIAVDPFDTYAYVVNYGSGVQSTITQYSIAGVTSATPGALTFASTAAPTQLNNATSIVIDHKGTYAYVANGSGLYQLPIKSDGSLNTGPSVGPIVTGGTAQQSVAIDPADKFVYVANKYNQTAMTGSVSHFSIDTGGALSLQNQINAGGLAYFITTAVSIQ